MTAPRLRFAPSPTGYLHIGGARTALFCWLMARRTGGTFILRVEDTDTERNTPEAVQAILEGMRWLGLDWDEGPGADGGVGPYFQSQRFDIYEAHVQRLLDQGKAYRCYLTSEELAAARALAIAAGQPATAPRTWRDATPDQWPADAPYVIRVKAPMEGVTVVDDLVRGEVTFPNSELSDPVIVRSNGVPLYNFACVVDDHLMHISHVLRGDDHLSNTPKQIAIYDAFGWVLPQFAHLPLILGQDKKRLSKRHGATSVMGYDDMGYLPDAMINFLVRLGWSHGDQEIFTRDELVRFFGLNHVGKAPGVWNAEKLDWLNGQYLQQLDDADLAARVAPRIAAKGYPAPAVDDVLARRVATLKERSTTLEDLVTRGAFYWVDADDLVYDDKQRSKVLKEANLGHLQVCRLRLGALDEWSQEAIEEVVRAYSEEQELKLGKVAQPLRVAVVGTNVSPGIFETLAALGQDQSLRRLDRAIALARDPEAL